MAFGVCGPPAARRTARARHWARTNAMCSCRPPRPALAAAGICLIDAHRPRLCLYGDRRACGIPIRNVRVNGRITKPSPRTRHRLPRFYFQNSMLELLWVDIPEEARSQLTCGIKLWERWSERRHGSSPFGIILCPDTAGLAACPFDSWEYRPTLMPELVLQIAVEPQINEPMWCYLEHGRAPAEVRLENRQPLEHAAGVRMLTRVTVISPPLPGESVTRRMADQNMIVLKTGNEHLLELEFNCGEKGADRDFRPDLSLVIRRTPHPTPIRRIARRLETQPRGASAAGYSGGSRVGLARPLRCCHQSRVTHVLS